MTFTYAIIALLITFTLVPILTPTLKRMKLGQGTREEGPQSHMKRIGTPTMSGLTSLISIIIFSIAAVIFVSHSNPIILLLFITVGFGLIGSIDDYTTVVKKNNQGLTSEQKFPVQIIIVVIFFVLSDVFHLVYSTTDLHIPFVSFDIPLSLAYMIFIVFWQVGFSSAVNLTDDLDGLATGLSIIGSAMCAVMSYMLDSPAIGTFCIIMISALLGFLPYNLNPTKVFMGDTGSLALGGISTMISIMLNQELSLILIGFVLVVEALSVMLQVASYKLTKKRIFKMSPIHHHFELSGWGEWKAATVFWTVGLTTGLIGLWIGVH